MKKVYRGHEIEVKRERCLGGWMQTYMSVFRISDGYEVICEFTDGEDTVATLMGCMKQRVDGYIADPRGECPDADYEELADHIRELRGL